MLLMAKRERELSTIRLFTSIEFKFERRLERYMEFLIQVSSWLTMLMMMYDLNDPSAMYLLGFQSQTT